MTTTTKTRRSTKPKESFNDKMARLRDKVDRFNEEYDEETRMEMIMRFASHGKGYSERNAALVLAQNPDALDVRGYKTWIDNGRIVRHGDHGIEILGKNGQEDGEPQEDGTKGKEKMFFHIVYVYDYSQTEPLAEHRTCEQCVKAKRPWTQ